MVMDLLQNWILMAIATPTFWAIGCLIDSCLVGSKIYKTPVDGTIVSCLFGLAPVLLIVSIHNSTVATTLTEQSIPGVAIGAALAYMVHLIFYFRTLHCLNDVAGTETFLSFSVLVVPVFAWWLLGERLPSHLYLAFIFAGIGALLQCWFVIKAAGMSTIVNLIVSVLAISLSMVLQAHALDTHGFSTANLVFNLVCFTGAALFLVYSRTTLHRLLKTVSRFPVVLVIAEGLGVLAIVSSHRATQLGPSVSMVALIECLLPLLIVAISVLLIWCNKILPLLSPAQYMTLTLQVRGVPSKCLAVMLLMISFFTILG